MPASDSHGVSACLVTSDHQIGSVVSAFGASDVDLTTASRSGDCDGDLSEDSARSTTCASCDEDVTVDSRAIDTSGPTRLDGSRTLSGNQPTDANIVGEPLTDDGSVDVDTPADTSLSSETLIGSGDATQEPPTDDLAHVDPKEGEDVNIGLAISLDESTRCDTNTPSAPTLESDPAQLSSPSQVMAPAPADDTQHDIGLDMSVDMSLETDAGNQDTPLGTPKADGDGTNLSAGDEIDHTSTAPDSSGLLSLPSISSSEMITNERADAFFADMTTDSFVGSREGLSAITEEDSGQVASTAVELLAEESLDITADMSLGSQLLDVNLAALGDSTNILDSALDGPAARKMEPTNWADDSDFGFPEPMYGPPLSASAHAPAPAPSPARLASALATTTKVNPSEDRPERLRTTGLETFSRQKRPTPRPNDLHKLLVSNNMHNAARSGPAPPFVAASPSLPRFSSPSSPAPSLLIPSASYVATSRGQDERKVGDSSMETSQKRTTRNKSASGQQAARKPPVVGSSKSRWAPVEGSSKSMWAPVGEGATGEGATGEGAAGQGAVSQDAVGQDAAGQDAASEDAAGQDAVGQGAADQDAAGDGVGETAEPRPGQRRSPSNRRGRALRGEARKANKNLPFSERK
ncbi:hypothetical protein FRC09_012413 [Ceratobasidium sp. 395]|nr:hypothetical protein FRC09_012413 [Ceratobasidium sp. 395]